LACSNGKTITAQSSLHPQTSRLQYSFYSWAPWSIAAFMFPFLAFVGIAVLGSRFHAAVVTLNGLFLGYALYGALYFHSSVTGDPGNGRFALAATPYFDPLVFVAVTAVFVTANAGAFWDGCRTIFGMPLAVESPSISPAAMSVALMPSVYEIDDPNRTAEFYRRETEKLLAAKSHLQAQTRRARAYLKAERAKAEHTNRT
jgi:hypothetical protein